MVRMSVWLSFVLVTTAFASVAPSAAADGGCGVEIVPPHWRIDTSCLEDSDERTMESDTEDGPGCGVEIVPPHWFIDTSCLPETESTSTTLEP